MQNKESRRLRALWQIQNGGQGRGKLLIRFQKKLKNSDVNNEGNDELYTTEVTCGESEEMCADRVRLKDRILERVSKAVKEVQAFSCEQGSELVAVKNDDRPLQKLVECLDHAFLHGLRHITPGYWAIVKKFTHKDIVLEIARLDRLATDLGRSRAWLYQSLNDTALESYIRCFLENKATIRKCYVEHALMRDKERLVLLQTLVSGLDFVTFDLQLNIAYFDLVSHIPRSASLDGDKEDQVSVHSCDDTSSVTSALSGAIADIDEISLASTPGDPADKTIKPSWLTSPDGMVVDEAWATQEKCPPSPLIASETTNQQSPVSDENRPTIPENSSIINDQPAVFPQTDEPDRTAVRPASLETVSRIERLSSITPQGEEQKYIKEDDVLVIRLKGKKGKKSKKKKKSKSLSQGNTPTCAGAAPGFLQDEDSTSLELDLENRSKSSSFSSQSTSDKSSVLDLSMLSVLNQDVQNRSSPVLSDCDKNYEDLITSDPILSTRSDNSPDAIDGSADSHLNCESDQDNSKKQLDSCLKTNQEKEKVTESEMLNLAKNYDNECVLPNNDNVQSESTTTLLTTKGHNEPRSISNLPKTSSLDFDTTIEYSLSSINMEVKPSLSQLLQVQFESSMDDSVVSNLSIDDPGYTNLLITNSTPSSLPSVTAEQSESDLSTSLGQGSSSTGQGSLTSGRSPIEEGLLSDRGEDVKGNESDDLSPLGERLSPEGIDSSKVIVDSSEVIAASEEYEADRNSIVEATEQVTTENDSVAGADPDNSLEQSNKEILTHPAEVVVDNNAKLYLMLEIFKNEHEEFKKLVRMSTGHTEGDLEPLFVLLTDQAIYLLRRGERLHRYVTDTRIMYNDLDYISVSINYQTIQLVCANRRNQFWLNTGDEQLSRYFLQELSKAMEAGCRTRNPPSILTDATTQLISLQKFAANECHTEMQDTKVQLYSLIHWEDLVDSATDADMQLYQPMIIKEGKLQFKCAGSFLVGSYWKDAYFMLRNDTFYRFGHRKDKDPELAVQLRTQHFGGCRRVRSGERPSCFELILQDGTALEIACKNEMDVSNWLQAICRVVAQGVMLQHQGKTHSPCQPCCSVLAENKLLICHEDCQTNFYRSLASCNIADISSVAVDQQIEEYVILEFQPPDNPWVIYFNCLQEKDKFLRTMGAIWKQQFQVDIPIHKIEDQKVQKRCQECLTLIHSAWQRCDSLTRGRIGGNIW